MFHRPDTTHDGFAVGEACPAARRSNPPTHLAPLGVFRRHRLKPKARRPTCHARGQDGPPTSTTAGILVLCASCLCGGKSTWSALSQEVGVVNDERPPQRTSAASENRMTSDGGCHRRHAGVQGNWRNWLPRDQTWRQPRHHRRQAAVECARLHGQRPADRRSSAACGVRLCSRRPQRSGTGCRRRCECGGRSSPEHCRRGPSRSCVGGLVHAAKCRHIVGKRRTKH